MNEFKVGLLALSAIMATIYMSFKITSNQSGFGDYIAYQTIISNASGIFPKTSIKVAGINAGRIKKIELRGNKALIHFEVLKDIQITTDSTLVIKTVGFLGDKYLEIIVGDTGERLPENGFVIAEEGGGIENLMKDASGIVADVKVIMESLKGSIAPENREAPLTTVLRDIESLMKNAKEAMTTINEIMDTNHAQIDNLISNLEKFGTAIAYQVDKKNSDSLLNDVKKIMANVDELTFELKSLVTDIKSGKGTVGQFLVENDIADEVKETLSGVKKIVNKVDAIRTEISVFMASNSEYGNRNDIGLKIFPGPDRFYLIGVRSSEYTPTTITQTTTTINGGTAQNKIEEKRKKDSYRFNAQMGRKFHNLTLRGGIIESTGGMGIDYDLNGIGTTVSLEVFDYRKDIGINLRLSSEIQLWNIFYGKLEFEDVLENNRSFTFGAGLKFNDDDIKSLVGLLL